MAQKKTLEFANFVLTFGPSRVMLDFFDEIVAPALLDSKLKRKYGETTYFFTDVEKVNLGTKSEPELAIAGTFIKDTVLRASQVWNSTTGQLEPSNRKIPNAPSATFILLLANHKLLYLHEASQAPGIDAFRGTLVRFLTRKWLEFVEREYARRAAITAQIRTRKTTKKALKEEYPPPELSIVPLSSEAALVEAMTRFKIISSARVTLTRVNAESDNNPFFAEVRAQQNSVGADVATLTETKLDKKASLDKPALAKQLSSVSREGNARVHLWGTSTSDDPLDIDNEELRLRIPMTNLPDEPKEKWKSIYGKYLESVSDGSIVIAKVDEGHAEALSKIFGSQ